MTFKEFTGKNVEEAIRTAMREFESDLSDLDIEILAQGSRSILGVGGEDARILAAPKSAVAAAETVRVSEPMADADDDMQAPAEPVEAVPFAIDERRRTGRRPGARRERAHGRRIEPRRTRPSRTWRAGRPRPRS